jgi:GNAT superfamily N-acetyltransferase
MKSNFHLKALWEFDLSTLVTLSNASFADYFFPVQFTETSFLTNLTLNSVSWDLSRVLVEDEVPFGFILIARRGWSSRVAGMGLLAAHRNRGLGSQALEQIISEACERGDQHLELEVITENKAAVHLYEKFGFLVLQDLFSFQRPAGGAGLKGPIEIVDIRTVAHLIAAAGDADLPWQLSAETISMYSPPTRAYHLAGAYAAITDPEQQSITLMSLIVEPDKRGEGRARALLQSVLTNHNRQSFRIPALCPAAFESLLKSVGFQRGSLGQYHMRLDL